MFPRRSLVVLLLFAGCRLGTGATEKERADVPEAAPVTVGTVRYEAPPWTRSRGLPQNGGYVAAIDTATGKVLWLARIYAATGVHGIEDDKRDTFITELRADAQGRRLIVTDERGRRFHLDLKTRRVARLPDADKKP